MITTLTPKYTINDLHWLGGRENFITKDNKYKIKNWVQGYEKGFDFVKLGSDNFEVHHSDDFQISRLALFTANNLQSCIDWLNKFCS